MASRYFKTQINHSQNQSISRLRSIIRKTWAYQNFNKSFARHWHVHTPINHVARLGHIKTRSIICKTLGISRLTDQSFARLEHIKIPINHRKSLAYPYSNYHSQDSGISIKTRPIIHKTWVSHRALVRYIIHLYCFAVQAGFYSEVIECST